MLESIPTQRNRVLPSTEKPDRLSKWKKVSLSIIGAVVLGAIGSGLWDTALKPVSHWLGKLILAAVTFGSSSLTDSIYREAAKGIHEQASLTTLNLLVIMIISIGSTVLYGIFDRLRDKSGRKPSETSTTNDPEERIRVLEAEIALVETKIRDLRNSGRKLVYFTILLFCFEGGALFIRNVQIGLANSAYVRFAQSLTICRPYIGDNRASLLASQFAAIQGRHDYTKVIDQLKQIANANHLKLPD